MAYITVNNVGSSNHQTNNYRPSFQNLKVDFIVKVNKQ